MTDQPLTTERVIDVETLPEHATTDRSDSIRVLDLYCGAGGVGVALRDLFTARDGTYLGVDIDDRSDDYPGTFVQADASTLTLADLELDEPVDLVWASPPCQAYSTLAHIWHDDPKAVHPTIDELNVRSVCERLGREYVIENVAGCDDLRNPITLTGAAFDLDVTFTRKFETSFPVSTFTKPATEQALRIGVDNEADIARAKHVPAWWGKTEIRSAMPPRYVGYLLAHCPTLPDIYPPDDPHCETYRRQRTPDSQRQLTNY